MGDAVADLVLVVGELSPALRRCVLAACEQARVQVVDLRDVEVVPVLACEPLLVVAALPTGSRVVPPALAALLAHELPDVPLCLFSEEHLVRPSITLNNGRLHLVGAPLGELRVTAWLHALLRRDRAYTRESSVASVIGGRVCTTEQRLGALALATVTHDVVDAPRPQAIVEASIGRRAVLALGPPGGSAPTVDANGCLIDGDGVVGLSVDRHRALRISVGRDDTEVRICSPHRVPPMTAVDRNSANTLVLPLEAGDVVLVSWPRGAIDDRLFSPLLLDGLQPTLAALELMNRVRTTAFAAVACEVR